MTDDKHIVSIRIEAKYGAYMTMECLYDVADNTRPCWPHDERSEPLAQAEGERDGCVYADWVDNDGLESIGGPTRTVRFDLADAEWGDGFTFTLGKFLGCEETS